jgi:hypothetical protein
MVSLLNTTARPMTAITSRAKTIPPIIFGLLELMHYPLKQFVKISFGTYYVNIIKAKKRGDARPLNFVMFG